MFKINEDMSIYVTRGDMVTLGVSADSNGQLHTFQPGDLVRFKVFEKKGCDNVVLLKDVYVDEATEKVDILLTGEDTKFGGVINKPTDYWYEVELNPLTVPQTIIGYDEEGAKVFRLYPEGGEG